jgi:hypothetical protein
VLRHLQLGETVYLLNYLHYCNIYCRYEKIKRAVHAIDTEKLFQTSSNKKDKKKEFEDKKVLVNRYSPILDEVLPILSRISQWVQILSSNTWITISKVMCAFNDIKLHIGKLKNRIEVS